MILCVTLNACLDKTLIVPRWRPGDQVRGTSASEIVGGKGNNVARALRRLGRDARPALFLGGSVGQWCETLLRRDDGLEPFVVSTHAPTRTILTVRVDTNDAEATAFFDPDPPISQAEAAAFLSCVEGLLDQGDVQALSLSGSSPAESTHGVYSELIAMSKARRIPVFLDTYGAALRAIWGFWPDVVKLNRREAADFLSTPNPSDSQIFELLDSWAARGVKIGMVTNGPNSILVRADQRRLSINPPQLPSIVNPIGCGDCLLAGLIDGWIGNSDGDELLQRGIACASANAQVWDAGAIDPPAVAAQPLAEIQPISVADAPVVERSGGLFSRGRTAARRGK